MSTSPNPSANLKNIRPYQSARSLCKGDEYIFMDAGEIPESFATSSTSFKLPSVLCSYPDPSADQLRDQIADFYDLDQSNLIITSGIDECIDLTIKAFVQPDGSICITPPTFPLYKFAAEVQGRKVIEDSIDSAQDDIVFLCSPNNPTGTVIPLEQIAEIADQFNGLVVVDEAYGEFLDVQNLLSAISLIQKGYKNILVYRTFSKAYAAAGIRVGYGIAAAGVIEQLMKAKLPYNVNSLSQSIACALWQDRQRMQERVLKLIKLSEELVNGLREQGCKVIDSITHFCTFWLPEGVDANMVYEKLRDDFRILVRPAGFINGREALRVSTGDAEQNRFFLEAISSFINKEDSHDSHDSDVLDRFNL